MTRRTVTEQGAVRRTIFVGPPGQGGSTFLELTDTPGSYAGNEGDAVVVNPAGNGLEFVTPTGIGDMTKAVYDPASKNAQLATEGELNAHIGDTGNPHNVTAAQAGAAPIVHLHTLSDVTDSGTAAARNVPAAGDATGAECVLGSDTRLTDKRPPEAHAIGGVDHDPSTLAELSSKVSNDSLVGEAAIQTIANKTLGANTELGADITTKGNHIVVTDGGSVEEGRIVNSSSGGVAMAKTTGGVYNPTDGGVVAEPSGVRVSGSAMVVDSLDAPNSAQVYAGPGGILYTVDPPEPGWSENDSDTADYDLGSGTGQGADTQLTGLSIVVPPGGAVVPGERVDIATNLYTENKSGNQNGQLEVGFGINGAAPTAWIPNVIGGGFAGYIALNVTATATTLNDGDTLHIWARINNGSNPNFGVDLLGSIAAHTMSASKAAAGGGGGGEANTQPNQGTGAQIGMAKNGVELPLRTLVSGDASVSITQNPDELDIRATGAGGGQSNTQTNQGGGLELGLPKNGVDLPIRTLNPAQFSEALDQVSVVNATTTAPGLVELATNGENAANVAVQGNDARLSDSRPPNTHALAGGDHSASTLAQLNALVSDATLDDSSDPRTPTAHTHTLADVTDSGTAAGRDVPSAGDAGAAECVLGADSRLTDARTPTAHTHTLADVTDSGTMAAEDDAASDGTKYVRQNGAWVAETPGGAAPGEFDAGLLTGFWTPDYSNGPNQRATLNANVSISPPTNTSPGDSGFLVIDTVGSTHTLSFSAAWEILNNDVPNVSGSYIILSYYVDGFGQTWVTGGGSEDVT